MPDSCRARRERREGEGEGKGGRRKRVGGERDEGRERLTQTRSYVCQVCYVHCV